MTPPAASRRLRDMALAARRTLVDGLRSPARIPFTVQSHRHPPPSSAFARFGRGSRLVAPVRVEGEGAIEIGDDVLVEEDGTLAVDDAGGGRLSIGPGTRLGAGFVVVCQKRVEVGANVLAGRFAAVTDSWGWIRPTTGAPPDPPAAAVTIGDDVSIGDGAIVLPGVAVGRGAVIGAGAVVLDDVEAFATVLGNPIQQ